MSHLVEHVLTEPELLRIDADLGHEEEGSTHEVAQDSTLDHAL